MVAVAEVGRRGRPWPKVVVGASEVHGAGLFVHGPVVAGEQVYSPGYKPHVLYKRFCKRFCMCPVLADPRSDC